MSILDGSPILIDFVDESSTLLTANGNVFLMSRTEFTDVDLSRTNLLNSVSFFTHSLLSINSFNIKIVCTRAFDFFVNRIYRSFEF